jgi:hypothetical protein
MKIMVQEMCCCSKRKRIGNEGGGIKNLNEGGGMNDKRSWKLLQDLLSLDGSF